MERVFQKIIIEDGKRTPKDIQKQQTFVEVQLKVVKGIIEKHFKEVESDP